MRRAVVRSVLALGAVLALAWTGAATAQSAGGTDAPPAPPNAFAPVPFGVGERLVYEVKFGAIKVGQGSMEVLDTVTLRGRPAWHTRFRVRGGIPFYRVDDVLESWIDRYDINSLRFVQDFDEGGKNRERRYEIFPDRAVFQENDKAEEASVSNPLDDGSFLYFIRTIPLEVGKTYEFHRYDGAGHGFFYWHRPLYRPEQAMDGWSKIWAFFGKHLAK